MSAKCGARRDGAGARPKQAMALVLACALVPAAVAKPVRSFWTSFEAGEPAAAEAASPAASPAPRLSADGGPPEAAALTAKPGVGFSGMRSLRYQGVGSGA